MASKGTDMGVKMSETSAQVAQAERDKRLEAILPHVGFDGWSLASVRAAASDLEESEDAFMLWFPEGISDLVGHYLEYQDRRMIEGARAADIDSMKIRARITFLVRSRLEQAEGERDVIRRTLTFLSLPQNISFATKRLWKTADIMWRLAGDRATDYNHYTKRTILSGVYSSTLLYWVNDKSEGNADTWAFLDRRIAGVMQFEKVKAQVLKQQAQLPNLTRFLGRLRYGSQG
ncbi:MAG: COQ9 family protein [Pseudomonadota bacterium]